jgi:dolichyl-phosphate-mannose-protein mannosyltransferase
VVNDRVPRTLGAAAALAAFMIGAHWGTFAAGGSDSSCYLNQARLFALGTTHIEQPLISAAFWPNAEWTFTPAGHRPSTVNRNYIVPICPPGLPLAMAAASLPTDIARRLLTAGASAKAIQSSAELLVVPLCGALLAWCTFLLGRQLRDAWTGAIAAALVVCSPIVLYQVVQPMSDVPAAAWWLLAIVLAVGSADGASRPVAAGLAVAVAVLTRPNLLPLAGVVAVYLWLDRSPDGERDIRRPLWFAIGLAPGLIALAVLQAKMYGSPFATGYGPTQDLFQAGHVLTNLRRYARWLVDTHTTAILLAAAAPFVARRRRAAWLCAAFSVGTLISYLPYQVFDDWWYLRFLLPAIPLLVVLSLIVVAEIARRTIAGGEVAAVAVVATVLAAMWITTARHRSAFDLVRFERHFIEAGTYAADHLPSEAAVLTVLHSGSVHYYSQRPTLSWDTLPPDSLDRTLAWLRDRGLTPMLMLDASEEQTFRARFERGSAIGRLDWPPAAQIGRTVRAYDPADRARYFAR